MCNKHKLGLIVGSFAALIHAVWAILVALVPDMLQKFLNWIFELHFLSPIYTITSFNAVNAVILVFITFIGGYVVGWVFGWIWGMFGKKLK